MKIMRLAVAGVVSLAPPLRSPPAAGPPIGPVLHTAETTCDGQCLVALIDQYLALLPNHDPRDLPVAARVKYTENGQVLRLGDGLWRTVTSLGSYRIYAIDPESGGAAVQTVVNTGASIVQLMIRLKISRGRVTEIETVAARRGESCCWDAESLNTLSSVYDDTVPRSERSGRSELIAITDSYFAALQAGGTPSYSTAAASAGHESL